MAQLRCLGDGEGEWEGDGRPELLVLPAAVGVCPEVERAAARFQLNRKKDPKMILISQSIN